MASVMAMSGAAYDAQALNGLKRCRRRSSGCLWPGGCLVEGMFVQMLKSMRAATAGWRTQRQTRFTPRCTIRLLSRCRRKGIRAGRRGGQADEQRQRGPQRTGTAPMALDNGAADAAESGAGQMIAGRLPKPPAAANAQQRQFVAVSMPARRRERSGIHQLIVARRRWNRLGQREIPTADDGTPSSWPVWW